MRKVWYTFSILCLMAAPCAAARWKLNPPKKPQVIHCHPLNGHHPPLVIIIREKPKKSKPVRRIQYPTPTTRRAPVARNSVPMPVERPITILNP